VATAGLQLGLVSLEPGTYVSQGVLDAATASAAVAFGWRTLEGGNDVSDSAPILLSCDWWTSVIRSCDNHAGIARGIRRRFRDNALTLIGAFYENSHYVAARIRITRTTASIVVRDSMRTVVKSTWAANLINLSKLLQKKFPELCQIEPTCVSGDTVVQQKQGVDCALFAFANITALAEDHAKTCPAEAAASLRERLAQILWARGTWTLTHPGYRQLHPAEFTGADITCLRQWKDEFLGPPQAGYAARAPAAAGEVRDLSRGRRDQRTEPPPRAPPRGAFRRNAEAAADPLASPESPLQESPAVEQIPEAGRGNLRLKPPG